MHDLIVRGARVVDPLNNVDSVCDIAVDDGRIAEVAEEITGGAARTVDASGMTAVPGIIDMHTHMRTVLGHPHAQRMIALAGVCTTLDMAGPLDNILESIPGSGAGVNIAVLEAARAGVTLSSNRPDAAERRSFIESVLERGGIGIKLLGGHFPMDLDMCEAFIEDSSSLASWVAWHVGNSVHGSNIEGLRDAVAASRGRFLHVAHVNSYCRAQVRPELEESLEAIDLLRQNPHIFSESYLSPLNGTRLTVKDGVPASGVTATCLRKMGFPATGDGMRQCLLAGKVGALKDDGTIGRLVCGEEALKYWEEQKTSIVGSFSVNPAVSRFLIATAKRADGSFVVDSFSTDGGSYPRNVIVENGMLLVKFGALSMMEFAVKASLNGARALGLPGKGHLAPGADADITVIDAAAGRADATIVGGKVIMEKGVLEGRGTTIICDERGKKALEGRGIRAVVKQPLRPDAVRQRFVP